jgi:hypothetical protein
MTGDIDLTVRALVASLEAPPDPATHNELSPVLSVLTVLLSLDKRKPGYVEERIQRLQSPDPGYNTLVGIRSVVGSPDDACLTSEQYFRMDPRDDGKRAAARARVSSTRIPGSGVSVFAVHRHFISWRLEWPPRRLHAASNLHAPREAAIDPC